MAAIPISRSYLMIILESSLFMRTDMEKSLTTALSGLQAGVNKAAMAAGEVGKLTTGSKEVQDAVRPLLKLQEAENQVAVASQVIKADNETLGSLIDVTA